VFYSVLSSECRVDRRWHDLGLASPRTGPCIEYHHVMLVGAPCNPETRQDLRSTEYGYACH
jgi:hypothetical protein